MVTVVSCLRLGKLAFECDALVRFVDALDAIFRLDDARKLLDYFKGITWHIPADRPESNDISDFEFVGSHRLLARFWRINR
jgi:hypothetical protein